MVLADTDWQPFANAVTKLLTSFDSLVGYANLILVAWLWNSRRQNDRNSKAAAEASQTAAKASIATAAATGVKADVLPEVRPVAERINGSGLGERVGSLERDVAAIRTMIAQMAETMRPKG